MCRADNWTRLLRVTGQGVVLAAILLGSGLGSLAAASFPMQRLTQVRFLLPVAIAAVTIALTYVFEASLGASLPARVGISLGLLFPLGFALGFPFPAGMIRFGDRNRAWFWALNRAASVLATVSSVTLATYTGLTGVAWLGVGCYLVACVVLPRAEIA